MALVKVHRMAPDLDLETATALRSATAQGLVQHSEMVQVTAQQMEMVQVLVKRW
jgi:aryl-alcohol dehydrogenase-like predicted oxidoreductase